jgi:hypothetical protein
MPDSKMVYKEPTQFQELPVEVVRDLDGDDLQESSGDAIQLLTVSEDGWPHVMFLTSFFLAVSTAMMSIPYSATTRFRIALRS